MAKRIKNLEIRFIHLTAQHTKNLVTPYTDQMARLTNDLEIQHTVLTAKLTKISEIQHIHQMEQLTKNLVISYTKIADNYFFIEPIIEDAILASVCLQLLKKFIQLNNESLLAVDEV